MGAGGGPPTATPGSGAPTVSTTQPLQDSIAAAAMIAASAFLMTLAPSSRSPRRTHSLLPASGLGASLPSSTHGATRPFQPTTPDALHALDPHERDPAPSRPRQS